jgi:hypothetical protein
MPDRASLTGRGRDLITIVLMVRDAPPSPRGETCCQSKRTPTTADGAETLGLGNRGGEIMHGALQLNYRGETIVEAVWLPVERANWKVETYRRTQQHFGCSVLAGIISKPVLCAAS